MPKTDSIGGAKHSTAPITSTNNPTLTPEGRAARRRYFAERQIAYWNRRAEREASAQAEEPKATQPSKNTEKRAEKRAESRYKEVASAMNKEIKRPQPIEKLSRAELEKRYHTLESSNDLLVKEVMRLEGLLYVYQEDAKRIYAIAKDAVAQYPNLK